MGDSDQLRLLLREKYGLVHVPHFHKAGEWAEQTAAAIRNGVTPEEAGLTAARELFPYEIKEYNAHLGAAVSELVKLAGGPDPWRPDAGGADR